MDFKIREDKFGLSIIADANDFNTAIEFIKNNNCNGLQLRGFYGNTEILLDFKNFEIISDKLTYLSFSSFQSVKNIGNFDKIYSLQNLKYLFFQEKESFKIDVSKFKNLIQLGAEYWNGIENIEHLLKIEILVLGSYTKKDLSEFENLQNLRTLHIYRSKIENLNHLKKMINLHELSLVRNSQLVNILGLRESKSLSKLIIEQCKNITDLSILSGNNTIIDIFIDKVDSISFVSTMNNLEKINFGDCKDGDLHPILKAPKIVSINFFPNKKHYSHTKEEIVKLLKEKK